MNTDFGPKRINKPIMLAVLFSKNKSKHGLLVKIMFVMTNYANNYDNVSKPIASGTYRSTRPEYETH